MKTLIFLTIAIAVLSFSLNAQVGWTAYEVSGADFVQLGHNLVDVKGLVTDVLLPNTAYEFKAILWCSTPTVTDGVRFAVNITGPAPTSTYCTGPIVWPLMTFLKQTCRLPSLSVIPIS